MQNLDLLENTGLYRPGNLLRTAGFERLSRDQFPHFIRSRHYLRHILYKAHLFHSPSEIQKPWRISVKGRDLKSLRDTGVTSNNFTPVQTERPYVSLCG